MPEFELTDYEQDLVDLVLITPAPGKHCARNAFRHIEKAYRLADVDREMAAFRAITAEEEAATAVFHAIKRRKYPGSDRIRPRDHVQKSALSQFVLAVVDLFREVNNVLKLDPQLVVDMKNKQLFFQVNAKSLDPQNSGLVARPWPPLEFVIHRDEDIYDFGDLLDKIAQSKKMDTITKHVESRANQRNRLLYASTAGAPEVLALNRFLERQREYVDALIITYLLIDPHPQKQSFVQQGLQAFLKMLGRIEGKIEFQ